MYELQSEHHQLHDDNNDDDKKKTQKTPTRTSLTKQKLNENKTKTKSTSTKKQCTVDSKIANHMKSHARESMIHICYFIKINRDICNW